MFAPAYNNTRKEVKRIVEIFVESLDEVLRGSESVQFTDVVPSASAATSGDWQGKAATPQPFTSTSIRFFSPSIDQSTFCTQWLAASSKWTYHILTPNKPSLPALPNPLNFPLSLILPSRPLHPLQTLPVPFDQQHAPGLPSRKWPKTATFQIRQRQPPQNPHLVKLAPTTIPTLPNAPVIPKARVSPTK